MTTTHVFAGAFVGEQGSVPEPEGGLLMRAATRALGTIRRKPAPPPPTPATPDPAVAAAPVLRGKPMSEILQRGDAVRTRIVLTEAPPPPPPRKPVWLRLRACFEPSLSP